MESLRMSAHRNNEDGPQLVPPQRTQRRQFIELSDSDEDDDVSISQTRQRIRLQADVRAISVGRNWIVHPLQPTAKVTSVELNQISDSDDVAEDQRSASRSRHNKRPKLKHEPPRPLPYPKASEGRRSRPISIASDLSADQLPKPQQIATASKTPLAPGSAKAEIQPWYHDTKLDCDMYRGHGFEKFPVALGTVEGHKEICDEYKRRLQAEKGSRNVHHVPKQSAPNEPYLPVLASLLEVLPDISHGFVAKQVDLIVQHNPGLRPEQVPTDVLLNQILELTSYPKEPVKKEIKQELAADGTGVTVAIRTVGRDTFHYTLEAVILLAWQFPHVPTHYIYKTVDDKQAIYSSYLHLHDAETTYYQLENTKRPYRRNRQPRQSIEKKYHKPAHVWRNYDLYGYWVNEVQAAKQHIERESIKTSTKEETDRLEAANLEEHRARGTLIECQVCFDEEIPINRAVTCSSSEGHLFCYSCVRQLADTQVGQMQYEMNCMDGSGCKHGLDIEAIGKAVPLKTIDRLAFNQQQAEITSAAIEGLEECPACDFKAIVDPAEELTVFNCLNPDCGRASCLKCKEEAHVPMTCEEFKNDRGLSARHAVEEARSASVLRTCPTCKVKIIKEYGCNKMTCTQCHSILCYVCKADITKKGYDHFSTGDGKCTLYDNDTAGLHEAEAAAAELEAIKKAKAQDADLDETKLQIETGKAKKPRVAVGNPHMLPHMAPMPRLVVPPDVNNRRLPPAERRMQQHQARAMQRHLLAARQERERAILRAHNRYNVPAERQNDLGPENAVNPVPGILPELDPEVNWNDLIGDEDLPDFGGIVAEMEDAWREHQAPAHFGPGLLGRHGNVVNQDAHPPNYGNNGQTNWAAGEAPRPPAQPADPNELPGPLGIIGRLHGFSRGN